MSTPKLNYQNIVPTLVAEIPSLRPRLTSHVQDQQEILPHVFFGNLTRYVLSLLDRASPSDCQDEIDRILAVLEKGMEDSDPDVCDLIGTSFLENLDQTGPHYDKIVPLLGPKLKASLMEMRKQMGFPD
jgi:hypothetical protein